MRCSNTLGTWTVAWGVLAALVAGPVSAAEFAVASANAGSEVAIGEYGLLNADAADTTNADQLWGTPRNLTGTGTVVGIWDQGWIRSTHQEFGSGSVTNVNPGTLSDHSTHVAGTIAAKGVNTAAHGMAPGVTIYGFDWNDDAKELAQSVARYGVDISNHSYSYLRGWGSTVTVDSVTRSRWYGNATYSLTEDNGFGYYDSSSQAIDRAIHDNPTLLSVWAAGNDRNDAFVDNGHDGAWVGYFSTAPSSYLKDLSTQLGSGWYLVSATTGHPAPPSDGNGGTGYDSLPNGGQTAKNTLVVGAVSDVTADPQSGAAISTLSFSSYGGTDDGRLGITVVANGNSLYSTLSSGDSNYGTMSGTSMAAPNVTGTAALLHEHYRKLTRKDPLGSTQRAYLVHTATDVVKTNGDLAGPDYATGYGLVNAAAAADFLSSALGSAATSDFLFEGALGSASTEQTFSVTGQGLGGTLKATLVWTDLPGTPITSSILDNRTSMLVNDLDMWITDANNTVYYPWTLDITNPALSAVQTTANHVDTIEQVLLASTLSGMAYTVHVGYSGSLYRDLSQSFSLLISGLAPLSQVPEPSSLSLVLAALVAMGTMLRVRRRR